MITLSPGEAPAPCRAWAWAWAAPAVPAAGAFRGGPAGRDLLSRFLRLFRSAEDGDGDGDGDGGKGNPATAASGRGSLGRRPVLSALAGAGGLLLLSASSASAAAMAGGGGEGGAAIDGIGVVTRSDLGTSVRRATVRSAQIADRLDERWERFSDSLRDQNRCDPATGRRMYDNGYRRDGSRIGNPVLGDLCRPEPLLPLRDEVADLVLGSAEAEVALMVGGGAEAVRGRVRDVEELVGPAFARARPSPPGTGPALAAGDDEKRAEYSRRVYSSMRAYGELLMPAGGGDPRAARAAAADMEVRWGRRLLFDDAPGPLIPARLANRGQFRSPFPALTEDDRGDLAYEEGALLDGLGTLSAALDALQAGGIVGHWEISIPSDDYGEVVTIAIDDDISLGAQGLLREGRNGSLNGSVVTAITRAALGKFGISVAVDAFFLDPSTTKQDVFNPTQLVLNLSNIRGS